MRYHASRPREHSGEPDSFAEQPLSRADRIPGVGERRRAVLNKISIYGFPKKTALLVRRSALAALKSGPRAVKGCDISFILVSDPEIRKLNIKFRRVRRITDVISFLYERNPLRGDIYISGGRSRRQAAAVGHSWGKEISYLAVHGVLHLFGYTDYDAKNKAKMFKLQDKIW